MKQIIALQEYSDKIISLYEGEIRNIETELANKLIARGIVAEHDQTGGDSGYKSTIQNQTIIDGTYQFIDNSLGIDGTTAVTIDELQISAEDKIIIFFDGIKYELPRRSLPDTTYYYGEIDSSTGGPSFGDFPIIVLSTSGFEESKITQIIANNPTEATHTVKIVVPTETITTTELFRKAIQSVSPPLKNIKDDPSGSGGIIAGRVESDGPYEKANQATGEFSFAEGAGTTASQIYSHAEGSATVASGGSSHAEGSVTIASGNDSHAEGNYTKAQGQDSHAEGNSTTASGMYSHAEGANTTASGNYSHAQNLSTIAQGQSQTAIGKYNIAQGTNSISTSTDYAFIIGNGSSTNNRSNALAIKWDGTFVFANGTEISPEQFQGLLALLDTQVESGQG